MAPSWSTLFDDDEELGELLDGVFSAGRVGRRAALGMRRRAAVHSGEGQVRQNFFEVCERGSDCATGGASPLEFEVCDLKGF